MFSDILSVQVGLLTLVSAVLQKASFRDVFSDLRTCGSHERKDMEDMKDMNDM